MDNQADDLVKAIDDQVATIGIDTTPLQLRPCMDHPVADFDSPTPQPRESDA